MATSGNLVERPLWRGFRGDDAHQVKALVKHARAGGVGVLKPVRGSWVLYGDVGAPLEPLPLYVDWAIRAVESPTWREVREAPFAGLVAAKIGRDWRKRVDEWIARDAAFPGSTSATRFDCMTCGACCFDNHVVLDDEDLLRLKDGHLLAQIKRLKGTYVLPLLKETKACVHLRDLVCGAYAFRPSMCRDFPAGSEQCMTSREERYGGPFNPA